MSLELIFEKKDNWTLARCVGTVIPSQIPVVYAQMAEECQRTNITKLLVDVTEALIPTSTTDRYAMGYHAVILMQHRIKVAFVATPAQIDTERFGELVMKNRGVNARAFTDLPAAQEWLLSE